MRKDIKDLLDKPIYSDDVMYELEQQEARNFDFRIIMCAVVLLVVIIILDIIFNFNIFQY